MLIFKYFLYNYDILVMANVASQHGGDRSVNPPLGLTTILVSCQLNIMI